MNTKKIVLLIFLIVGCIAIMIYGSMYMSVRELDRAVDAKKIETPS